MKETKDLEAN